MEIVIQAVKAKPEKVIPGYHDRQKLNTLFHGSSPVRRLGRLARHERQLFSQPVDLAPRSPEDRQAGFGGEGKPDRPNFNGRLHYYRDEQGRIVYDVPDRLWQFAPVIGRIAALEHAAFSEATRDHASLSIEQSYVAPNSPQRPDMQSWAEHTHLPYHRDYSHEAWHHGYVLADLRPTEFLADPKAVASASSFSSKPPTTTGRPYEIVGFNSTTFHRSPIVPEGGTRTFMRLGYHHSL